MKEVTSQNKCGHLKLQGSDINVHFTKVVGAVEMERDWSGLSSDLRLESKPFSSSDRSVCIVLLNLRMCL